MEKIKGLQVVQARNEAQSCRETDIPPATQALMHRFKLQAVLDPKELEDNPSGCVIIQNFAFRSAESLQPAESEVA